MRLVHHRNDFGDLSRRIRDHASIVENVGQGQAVRVGTGKHHQIGSIFCRSMAFTIFGVWKGSVGTAAIRSEGIGRSASIATMNKHAQL